MNGLMARTSNSFTQYRLNAIQMRIRLTKEKRIQLRWSTFGILQWKPMLSDLWRSREVFKRLFKALMDSIDQMETVGFNWPENGAICVAYTFWFEATLRESNNVAQNTSSQCIINGTQRGIVSNHVIDANRSITTKSPKLTTDGYSVYHH